MAGYVDGVLGRGELVRYLDAPPAVHDHLDVVVGVDVYLFHIGHIDPFTQKRVARHILIELVAEFSGGEAFHGVFPFHQILCNQLFPG